MRDLKKYFLAGLIVVVPVALTLYVLVIAFQFIDRLIGRFLEQYLEARLGFYVPGVGFVLLAALILVVGFFVTRFFRLRLFIAFERWFADLPLVKSMYPAFKQIVGFVAAQKEFGFKGVVVLEYPSRGIWSLGFVTNEGFGAIDAAVREPTVAVFVPMSPNPLSGYVVFVRRQDARSVDMPVEEALNIIISGGVFSSRK